jgi:hypothetical protein
MLIFLTITNKETNRKILDRLINFKKIQSKKDLQNIIIKYARDKANFSKHLHNLKAEFYDSEEIKKLQLN